MTIDRRRFLAALAGLGAIAALPSDATDAEVDAAWAQADADAYTFLVADDGQLVDDASYEPPSREDLWCLYLHGGESGEELLAACKQCPPLEWVLRRVADEVAEDLAERRDAIECAERDRLDAAANDEGDDADRDGGSAGAADANVPPTPASAACRRAARRAAVQCGRLQQRIDALTGLDGLRVLLRDATEDELQRCRDAVAHWFAQPVDGEDADYRSVPTREGGHAYEFFRDQPFAVCRALGVKVVEGEHPGSTYYAAELRVPIAAANAAARTHGIPIRFAAR